MLGVYYIAGDISPVAILKTTENLKNVGKSNYDIIHLNSTKMPFASDSIDAIITDMPFGIRLSNYLFSYFS